MIPNEITGCAKDKIPAEWLRDFAFCLIYLTIGKFILHQGMILPAQ
jgi:hypothetical protein